MTDELSTQPAGIPWAPEPEPQPAVEGERASVPQPLPPLKVRLFLLNGLILDVGSPFSWEVFWLNVKALGFVVTQRTYTPYHAIAHVELLPPDAAVGDNIVRFPSK